MKAGTYKHTEETLTAMRLRRHTQETKDKISISRAGIKRPDLIERNKLRKGKFKMSDESKALMSESQKRIGNKPPSWEGRTHTEEWRIRQGERQRGDKSHRWLGGKTSELMIQRNSVKYKTWRDKVFKRDNYTCVLCGDKAKINADHIKSFAKHPELRFEQDNGRTLCYNCHKKTDNFGGKANRLSSTA